MEIIQETNHSIVSNVMTVSGQLRKLAEAKPDKPAFVFVDVKWNRFVLTRKEVWDLSRQYSYILVRNGLKKDEVLCNCLTNSPERLLLTYGTIIAGAISLHGKMIREDGSDLLNNLRISKCTTIVLDPGEKVGPYPTLKALEYVDKETGKLRYKGLPCLVNTIYISVYENPNFNDTTQQPAEGSQTSITRLPREGPYYENANVSTEDIVILFATSGTTGLPKMIPHTHKSLLAVNWCEDVMDETSIYFNSRCLGWVAGFPTSYMHIGYTRVLFDLRFEMPAEDVNRLYEILVKEKCNVATLNPMHIKALVNMVDSMPASDLRLKAICSSGAPVILDDLSKLWRITEVLGVYYGSTESNYSSGTLIKCGEYFHNSSIGKPLRGLEMRIVDEQQQDVPEGDLGELLTRGDATSKGYYNQPERNKGVFLPDGWVRVGDICFLDNKGDITLVNRKCDGILTTSGVVYPGLIERELAILPGIQGAILIGVPKKSADSAKTLHEEICACIHLLPESTVTVESLLQFCQDFQKSTKTNNPVPDYFLFFNEFPYLKDGKLSRVILKKQVLTRLNMQ